MDSQRDELTEKIFREFETKLEEVGLNAEVISTMVREFSRIAMTANHIQIHALLSLLESLQYATGIQHLIIASKDGLHDQGGQEDEPRI